jgi:hypothetical protein
LTQAKKVKSQKTLPHFVGAAIIMAQQIVCQEKNVILEIFFVKLNDGVELTLGYHHQKIWTPSLLRECFIVNESSIELGSCGNLGPLFAFAHSTRATDHVDSDVELPSVARVGPNGAYRPGLLDSIGGIN